MVTGWIYKVHVINFSEYGYTINLGNTNSMRGCLKRVLAKGYLHKERA